MPNPKNPVSFADVAHGIISFDPADEAARLILELIDTAWVQRLRRIRQTGNTLLVYMFAEHSRFGHSVGVAYLANRLMKHLALSEPKQVQEWELAVSAAAILHDIGHVAPGSHLAERVWDKAAKGHGNGKAAHELLSIRVVLEDPEISSILRKYDRSLPEKVARILSSDESLPRWAVQIISGGGWNADRGNWTIVDSAMCAVSYGRYNVFALLDAFRIAGAGELVLQESRLDALTHFFVARDSMYRQVYQHRVLQAVDLLAENIVRRLNDLFKASGNDPVALRKSGVFADDVIVGAMQSADYISALPLPSLFRMTEPWWSYHIERWCECADPVLSDLSRRMRDRKLFKTIRVNESDTPLHDDALKAAEALGLDPRYYVMKMTSADMHREKQEELPRVQLDSGELARMTEVEPLIGKLTERSPNRRVWLAVPKEIKEQLGRRR